MLEVPVQSLSTDKMKTPPCFRCLFEKRFPEGWCDPEKCDMLGYWLTDPEFTWSKYVGAWLLSLEVRHKPNAEIDKEMQTSEIEPTKLFNYLY